MKNTKWILGGGISGLIFAFYNKEYTIISPDLGGRLNKEFFKNIIYLHETKESEQFLKDVGITYNKKTQLIKYSINNQVTTDITKENKIQFIKKKLEDNDFNPIDLNLSTDDYYINILEFNFADLIEKIKSQINFIQDSIIRITEKELITENTRYEYSNLVSTLPAHIFWKIYYKPQNIDLRSKPITFVLCDKEPDHFRGIKYDMGYFVDDKQKYTRISKKPGERDKNNILYEFTGKYDNIDELKKYLPSDCNVIEHYIDYSGIIYSNRNNISPTNVLFVGRFAKWDHSGKQQDVIKESLFDFDFRDVWNRQANFSKFHIDFNRLKDVEYQQSLTKDYLLLLIKEATEVLDEINYKPQKKQKEVDKDKIREELIDIQKFLFNLMLIWNMSPASFIEIFDKKSTIVEQRFQKEKSK